MYDELLRLRREVEDEEAIRDASHASEKPSNDGSDRFP